jgi:hypothetical protein
MLISTLYPVFMFTIGWFSALIGQKMDKAIEEVIKAICDVQSLTG